MKRVEELRNDISCLELSIGAAKAEYDKIKAANLSETARFATERRAEYTQMLENFTATQVGTAVVIGVSGAAAASTVPPGNAANLSTAARGSVLMMLVESSPVARVPQQQGMRSHRGSHIRYWWYLLLLLAWSQSTCHYPAQVAALLAGL